MIVMIKLDRYRERRSTTAVAVSVVSKVETRRRSGPASLMFIAPEGLFSSCSTWGLVKTRFRSVIDGGATQPLRPSATTMSREFPTITWTPSEVET
jgi:hypothetical protein